MPFCQSMGTVLKPSVFRCGISLCVRQFCLVLFCFVCLKLYADSNGSGYNQDLYRESVAILNLKQTNDLCDSILWSDAVKRSISVSLKNVTAIRIIPDLDELLWELYSGSANSVDEVQAVNIGRMIDAKWIILIGCQYQQKTWKVRISCVKPKTDSIPESFVTESTNWVLLQQKIIEQILNKLSILTTQTKLKQIERGWILQPDTALLYSKAINLYENERLSEAEGVLDEVIKQYPDFSESYSLLAAIRWRQGRFGEGEQLCRKSILLQADLAYDDHNRLWLYNLPHHEFT